MKLVYQLSRIQFAFNLFSVYLTVITISISTLLLDINLANTTMMWSEFIFPHSRTK